MNFLKGKKVLITGASGSIGSALLKKVSEQNPKQVVALDNNETELFNVMNKFTCTPVLADIRDRNRIFDIMEKYKPEIVFHAAALKHVGMCEENPYEAHQTNVIGLQNVMNASVRFGAKKFIFISTDKAVNPSCVMGKTKQEGEDLCRMVAELKEPTEPIIVRFGNVVASRGSVFAIWQDLIDRGLPLTVNHKKMRRYFMGIYEAVDLVLKAAEIGKRGQTLVLDMGKQIHIEQMAKMMIKLSKKDLKIVYTKPSKGEKFAEELMTRKERAAADYKDGLWILK